MAATTSSQVLPHEPPEAPPGDLIGLRQYAALRNVSVDGIRSRIRRGNLRSWKSAGRPSHARVWISASEADAAFGFEQ